MVDFKVCLIYNYAQHYRESIFLLLEKEFGCDFVFGDKYYDVKKIDYSHFSKMPTEVKNLYVGPFLWQRGVLKYLFKDYDKYIMLGQLYDISTWLFLLFSKLLGKEVYLWSHGWYGRENSVKKVLKRLFFGLSKGVLLYGNYARELMIKDGFDSNRLFVVYNSLNYDKQLEIRNKLKENCLYSKHFDNNNPVLLFIGRLTFVKKLDMLIQVVYMSILKNKPLNLIFIGKGEDEMNLRKKVCELNLESYVWFYGASYDEFEISNLIYNADICVAPGNVGLTAIHSLAYGCPVITHDNFKYQMPEFEAIKKTITGDYFDQDNAESLYATIENWLSMHKNREYTRIKAYEEIDTRWNPYNQVQIIKKALNIK